MTLLSRICDRVFGPDLGNAPTPPAQWVPSSPQREWRCSTDGHLTAHGDTWCVICGDDIDG